MYFLFEQFRGTSSYASPHAHDKEDQCPRDDIYSLFFVFLDLICGKLPWTEHARNKERDALVTMKKVLLGEPQQLLDWLEEVIEDNAGLTVRKDAKKHCDLCACSRGITDTASSFMQNPNNVFFIANLGRRRH